MAGRKKKAVARAFSVPQRLDLARSKLNTMNGQLTELLALHANNAVVTYSAALASQVPQSRAANAFNSFQRSLHGFELVRLCVLWDTCSGEDDVVSKNCFAAVLQLIDFEGVEAEIGHRATAAILALGIPEVTDAPGFEEQAQEILRKSNEKWAEKEAADEILQFKTATASIREVHASNELKSLRNHRHKYLAHSLDYTNLEKGGPVEQLRFGDESRLLDKTVAIMEALNRCIIGAHYPWESVRNSAQKNAQDLWNHCTFKFS